MFGGFISGGAREEDNAQITILNPALSATATAPYANDGYVYTIMRGRSKQDKHFLDEWKTVVLPIERFGN